MITEKLKSRVRDLSEEDRRDLSAYLVKLQLEDDPDYWATLRERTESYAPDTCVDVDSL
jgi:hypothetical protein